MPRHEKRPPRKVLLTPEHSQWWLLSPGVSLYYDTLVMLRRDYEAALQAGGQSSYHEEIATRLETLLREGEDPVLEIVDSYPALRRDYPDTAKQTLGALFTIANDADDGALDPPMLLELLRDAFEHWIGYNERKVAYLHEEEPLRKLLAHEQIPAWRLQLGGLADLLNSPETEMLERLKQSDTAMETLLRLLTAACQCIDLVAAGEHIYDPMLLEYMPAIDLLERLRTAEDFFARVGGDVNVLFEAYRLRMTRYTDPVPIDLDRSGIRNLVAEFRPIREKLALVDIALKAVDDNDPARALELARMEIGPLVAAAKRAETATAYGFWATGLFSPLLAILGLPAATGRAAASAGALELARRNVGRFAGAYSTVADTMVTQQRIARKSRLRFARCYFEQHYWSFANDVHE